MNFLSSFAPIDRLAPEARFQLLPPSMQEQVHGYPSSSKYNFDNDNYDDDSSFSASRSVLLDDAFEGLAADKLDFNLYASVQQNKQQLPVHKFSSDNTDCQSLELQSGQSISVQNSSGDELSVQKQASLESIISLQSSVHPTMSFVNPADMQLNLRDDLMEAASESAIQTPSAANPEFKQLRASSLEEPELVDNLHCKVVQGVRERSQTL